MAFVFEDEVAEGDTAARSQRQSLGVSLARFRVTRSHRCQGVDDGSRFVMPSKESAFHRCRKVCDVKEGASEKMRHSRGTGFQPRLRGSLECFRPSGDG